MPEEKSQGQVDLEKELTCSICTEILYHPLTLLDCLHTFCGACVKEWFRSQAQRATNTHPYTCPACRASVRETKHNATISTLLDIYLQANPSKQRTGEDKKEHGDIYKPGDNVLPKLRRKHRERGRERDRQRDEEQRLLNEAMARSLEETVTAPSAGPSERANGRNRGRRASVESGVSRPEGRQVGMYLHTREEPRQRGRRSPARSASRSPAPEPVPGRTVEHQSSLISLLSESSQDLEGEIIRQITEGGFLDGVDVNNLTQSQEDQLSTRIYDAFKSAQEIRRRERRDRHHSSQQSRLQNPENNARHVVGATRPGPSEISGHANSQRSPPPTSGDIVPTSGSVEPRRDPELTVRRRPVPNATSTVQSHPRTRSSDRRPRSSHNQRRTTDPSVVPALTQHSSNPQRRPQESPQQGQLTRAESDTATTANLNRSGISTRLQALTFPIDRRTQASASIEPPLTTTADQTSSAITIISPQEHRKLYSEPSITCNRCNRPHIEYTRHYTCSLCDPAGYSLCLSCYRQGRGCLNWYGFGWAAMAKYQRSVQSGSSPADQIPHVLTPRRYLPPESEPVPSQTQEPRLLTHEDPAKRLQTGVFCDRCDSFANEWYWQCDTCNEGEWGYCNTCVNKGRHCTHALLSLAYSTTPPNTPGHAPASPPLQTLPPASGLEAAQRLTRNENFVPRTFSTKCDICTYPISPSISRFHCPQCNDGDYDIDQPCYVSLVRSGRIDHSNGNLGWRRCLKGHRMVLLGFEDRDGGQKRIVVRDLVGGANLREEERLVSEAVAGASAAATSENPDPNQAKNSMWSWKDEDGTVRNTRLRVDAQSVVPGNLPPDGGVGLRIVADWSYYPGEGVVDELMFPKGAEIKEAGDINGDWFWGVYAGEKGLFPGNYGHVIGRV